MRQPEILTISEIQLDNHEAVIGISVQNRHRAYVVRALAVPQDSTSTPSSGNRLGKQVVNDVIEGVAITVTYHEPTRQCRVLTSQDSAALDVAVISSQKENLVLSWGGREFRQSDPDLPLNDYIFTLTEWAQWKMEHPTTDVYVGSLYDEYE